MFINKVKNIFKNGSFPHAFIFYGPSGVGKFETALNVAKYLNCEKGMINFEENCHCPQCRMIDNRNHPDVYFVQRAENRKEIIESQIGDSKTEGSLIYNLKNTNLSGKYKICMIQDADLMNKYASNNLLKILEEPPNSTIFILLVSNIKGVLDTIKSRTCVIKFPLINTKIAKIYIASDFDKIFSLTSNKYDRIKHFLKETNLDVFISDIKKFVNITNSDFALKVNYIKTVLEDRSNLNYYVYLWEFCIRNKLLIDNNIRISKDIVDILSDFKLNTNIANILKKLYNMNDAIKGNYILKIYLNDFIFSL